MTIHTVININYWQVNVVNEGVRVTFMTNFANQWKT